MIESIVMELTNNFNEQLEDSLLSHSAGMNKGSRILKVWSEAPTLAPTTSDQVPATVDIPTLLFFIGVLSFACLYSYIKVCFCERPMTERRRRKAREDRKRLIRDRVVFKTVIKGEGRPEEEESETISTRGENIVGSSSDEENGQERQPSAMKRCVRKKSNLEIYPTSQHNLDDEDNSQRLECQICLTDFEVGDKICWSNNPVCVHTFHIACLEPWLMKHDECPSCRAPYLVEPKKVPLPNVESGDVRRTSPLTRRVVAALSLLCFLRSTSQALHHDRRNDDEEADQENDGIPEISLDNNTEHNDENLPSPDMIPLEEDSDDCPSSDEENTRRTPPSSDVETGVSPQ